MSQLGGPQFPQTAVLASFSSAIQSSLQEYEEASNPKDKAIALKKVQAASAKLSKLTTPLPDQLLQLNLGSGVNTAARIAVEMGFFDALPLTGESISLPELSIKVKAEEEFLLRIARVLGVHEVVQQSFSQSGVPTYSHTTLSRFFTTPGGKAMTKHLFDCMLHAQTASAGDYYAKYGFKSPEDSRNTPFSFAHGAQDASVFDLLRTMPRHLSDFNDAMTATAVLGLTETIKAYAFDQLKPNPDGIVLVDVGGGKGHVLAEMGKVYPDMKGKMVLQDLKAVLDGGVVVSEDEVALQPYDFFQEVQPIKGSNYFFKYVFHDWADKNCLEILKNLAPAMEGHANSRLLICDIAIPDLNTDAGKVLRDMNMLLIGGKERSISQWHTLLGQAGYKILGIYDQESFNGSIIEATYIGDTP